jgi:hypothetical protein
VHKAKKNNKRRSRTQARPTGYSPFVVCRIAPFSASAVGCKYPDSFSFPTSTVLTRSSYTLSTFSASGNQFGEWLFTPFVTRAYVQPASITAAGVTTWTSPTTSGVAIYSGFSNISTSYRPVGGGIRITVDTGLTTASGHIVICHVPLIWDDSYGGLSYLPTTEAQVYQYPLSEKYSMVELTEAPLVVPFRPISDASCIYSSSNADNSSFNGALRDRGWMGIVVFVIGGSASTQVINVEHLLHIEYLPQPTGNTFFGFGDAIPHPCNLMEGQMAINAGQQTPVCYVETKDHDEDTLVNLVLRKAATFAKAALSSSTATRAMNMAYSMGMQRAGRFVTSYIGAQEEYKMLEY